jgi:hypothetical protein
MPRTIGIDRRKTKHAVTAPPKSSSSPTKRCLRHEFRTRVTTPRPNE